VDVRNRPPREARGGGQASLLDLDHLGNENLVARIVELERRLANVERAAATGLFPDGGVVCVLPGGLELTLVTEDVEIVDAGSAGATEQDWIEVTVGGNTGYLRVFAAE